MKYNVYSCCREVDLYAWSNLLNVDRPLHMLMTVPNLETGKLQTIVPRLSSTEETELRSMLRRINTLAEVIQQHVYISAYILTSHIYLRIYTNIPYMGTNENNRTWHD